MYRLLVLRTPLTDALEDVLLAGARAHVEACGTLPTNSSLDVQEVPLAS